MKIFTIFLLGILIFFILLVAILLFSKMNLIIKAEKEAGHKVKLSLSLVFLGGLVKKNISISHRKKGKTSLADKAKAKSAERENDVSFVERVKKYYHSFIAFKKAYSKNSHRLYRSIYAKKISLNIDFGAGDAASTGILTGSIWAGIYNVIAFCARIIRISEPKINVNPDFNAAKLALRGECIISTRLANLIFAVVSIGISYLKNIKNK